MNHNSYFGEGSTSKLCYQSYVSSTWFSFFLEKLHWTHLLRLVIQGNKAHVCWFFVFLRRDPEEGVTAPLMLPSQVLCSGLNVSGDKKHMH
jgi:hypothetical protein